MDNLTQMVSSALAAARKGYGTLSTGEALAAALILNDHAVLADRGMTIPEALDRIGPDWSALIPEASKRVAAQLDDVEQTRRQVKKQEADQRFVDFAEDGEPVELEAKFITYGEAPGYRDAYLTLKLVPLGSEMDGPKTVTATVRLDAIDSAKVAQSIIDIHQLAWRAGHRPIDANETETRPGWLAS
ncbi:hypothetical protein [Marinobacter goseongensis]|uniref:hypothetical protein n=1 Tax=Marinobacter goseongensis TaxID=453838 RepID=UPI0020047846|nr:hypothetical protein [Marinobacter goseongensis]MCK7552787.1 hypothetical protein [Marinobacter goseongensis]